MPLDLSICNLAHTRLIIVERPGFGASDFQPERNLLDFASDITRLADSLDIDRFHLLGFSGGSVYAMACGVVIPKRIKRIGLVGSLAPFDAPQVCDAMPAGNRALFELAAQDYRQAAEQLSTLISSPDALFAFFEAALPPGDKKIFSTPAFRKMYLANLTESLRQGFIGPAYDMGLIAKPWGFDPRDIAVEVQLWHGEQDANTPVAMGQYLQDSIPDCNASFIPRAGHFWMFANYQQVLQKLVSAGPA